MKTISMRNLFVYVILEKNLIRISVNNSNMVLKDDMKPLGKINLLTKKHRLHAKVKIISIAKYTQIDLLYQSMLWNLTIQFKYNFKM